MKKRKISLLSLENLKLGTPARYKGKVRCTVTLLPETKAWLKKHHIKGNMSEQIDEVVRLIVVGELVRVTRGSLDKPT
ncbi:hypothetical protein [Nostoc commune]|uniref:hypothetical protein n=1 Tax=Nostoc commune TaxID=1178 RepID=UPI0018C536EA|nr:hypothetical protein [Nostoc commune]MBG1258411.1 hypothetical protein [Nostoc commune BAE]